MQQIIEQLIVQIGQQHVHVNQHHQQLFLYQIHNIIRIPNIDMNFLSTGFTIELWIRPDSLPNGNNPVQLINFRGEYRLTYQPKGEIRFSMIDSTHSHFYTTTLQAIPLNQWTYYIMCLFTN